MTDRSPLVSVLIPAYNAEEFLPRTLASVCRQTYRDLEIIVVDDASTDGTADIIAAAAATDGRIRSVPGPHTGISAARNTGAAHATADLLAPCDADDLWAPTKIEKQVAALAAAPPAAGVVYCWSDGIDDNDGVIFPGWGRKTAEGDVRHAMIMDSLPGSGSAPLMRKKYFDEVGGYPTGDGTDDWGLYIRLAAVCEWVLVPEVLVGYRLRGDSASADYRFMDRTMAGDTRWIQEHWPETPRDVLARRTYVVNAYLSFLALRGGHILRAIRYRLAALVAQPKELLGIDFWGFQYIAWLQLFGVQRYYFPFWKDPELWPGAVPLNRSGGDPATP